MICASSFVSWTRGFVFRVGLLAPLAGVLLFGLAVAAGSLLAPETALASAAAPPKLLQSSIDCDLPI